MVEKLYSWKAGAALEEHSKRKHKIVREYFARYLTVRCQLPMQSKFRLAIVDGFAGGGRYKCGSPRLPNNFHRRAKACDGRVEHQTTVRGNGSFGYRVFSHSKRLRAGSHKCIKGPYRAALGRDN